MMFYTEDQKEPLRNVAIVFLTSCIFSYFFAAFSIFVYYKHHDKFRNITIPRVVMLISVADILRCVCGMYLAIRYIIDQSDITDVGLCSSLGFIINFYECITHLANFLIPLLTYRSITHSIKSFEKKAYLCCLIVTIVLSSIPFCFLFLEDGGYQPVDGGMICFIKNYYLRIFCFYGPFLVTLVGSFIFIFLIYKITEQTSDLKMLVFPAIIFVCWIFALIRRIAEDENHQNNKHYIIWLMYLMRITLPLFGVLNPIGYLYFDDDFRNFWFGTFSNKANQEIEIQPQSGVPLINANEN